MTELHNVNIISILIFIFIFIFICSLVVGAPKFDTSTYQERVVEAGAVFKCSMNDDDCHLVQFDSKGK